MSIASVILCAGKGTRMKSQMPKVLHPVVGRPLFAWPIGAAVGLGSEPTIAVVGHEAERVKEAIAAEFGSQVKSALQAEQKGTGHAVQMALPSLEGFSGTVLLLCGDTPLLRPESLEALIELKAGKKAVLAMLTTRLADPGAYGRILRDQEGRISGIREFKDASEDERAIDEVNPGVYAVDADFLRAQLGKLDDNNAQGELYLTDLVAMAHALNAAAVAGLQVDPVETLGVNDRSQLAQAGAVLKDRILQNHMAQGVTIEDPATTWIEAGVKLGTDVTLQPGVMLKGKTQVENGATIGAYSVLTDTRVGKGSEIKPHSVCESAEVGEDCLVGPFARLRPQANLERGAKVGNFVEVKKARLGEGAKASHLAYIGDADIGAGSNIGAGTITCNYDGFGKNLTELGEGVFVGSNSTLVAPIKIGAGAYVGAGSTVTREVPSGDLAIGRARQDNKKGYADRMRARLQRRKEAKK